MVDRLDDVVQAALGGLLQFDAGARAPVRKQASLAVRRCAALFTRHAAPCSAHNGTSACCWAWCVSSILTTNLVRVACMLCGLGSFVGAAVAPQSR